MQQSLLHVRPHAHVLIVMGLIPLQAACGEGLRIVRPPRKDQWFYSCDWVSIMVQYQILVIIWNSDLSHVHTHTQYINLVMGPWKWRQCTTSWSWCAHARHRYRWITNGRREEKALFRRVFSRNNPIIQGWYKFLPFHAEIHIYYIHTIHHA